MARPMSSHLHLPAGDHNLAGATMPSHRNPIVALCITR